MPMRKKRDSISVPSYLGLLSEPLPLSDGVVQLGVGVANLLRVDEKLEPLRYPGDGSVPGNEAAMKRGVLSTIPGYELVFVSVKS